MSEGLKRRARALKGQVQNLPPLKKAEKQGMHSPSLNRHARQREVHLVAYCVDSLIEMIIARQEKGWISEGPISSKLTHYTVKMVKFVK